MKIIGDLSQYYRLFWERNKLLDHHMAINADINEIVYHSVKSVCDNETNVKKNMVTLLNNINLLRGMDFDIRSFYFDDQYK